MSCEQIREAMTTYTPGDPDLRYGGPLREHLQICAPCREFQTALQRLESVCELWEEVGPSPAFDARVFAALAAQDEFSWYRFFRGPFPLKAWSFGWPQWTTVSLLAFTFAFSVMVFRFSPAINVSQGPPMIEVAESDPNEIHDILKEQDKLNDFDAIANLELLVYFEEIKNQFIKPEYREGIN